MKRDVLRTSISAPGAGVERTEVHPNRFHWTDALVRMLGKMSDEAVATKAGITYQTVARERQRRRIPAYRHRRGPIRWTPEMIDLLGTASDRAIAAELGVSHTVVYSRRRRLGIAPFAQAVSPGFEPYTWTRSALGMLGSVSDRDLAKRLGVSHAAVRSKRVEKGIPAFQPPKERIRWTRRMLDLLGRAPDVELARQFGVVKDSVSSKRRELGIPPYRYRSRPIARTRQLRRILQLPNPELKRRYGVPKGTASKLRAELGLATPDSRNLRWPPEALARLGKEADSHIARDLGLTRTGVSFKRRSLGIAPFRAVHAWSDAETALLGKLPDEEIAARIGVTRGAVKLKRRLLRIPARPK